MLALLTLLQPRTGCSCCCRASNSSYSSLSSPSAVDLCICSMLNPRVINYQPVPPFTHPKRTELIELLRLPLSSLFATEFAFFNLLLERSIPREGRGAQLAVIAICIIKS